MKRLELAARPGVKSRVVDVWGQASERHRPPSPSTKPYEFIALGARNVTRPHEFIGCGAKHVAKPYGFVGYGAKKDTKLYEFIGFGARDTSRNDT